MAAVKNASYSVVAVAPSPAASGITLTVSAGHGARFAVGRPATIYPVGAPPLGDNFEVVTVTDVTGDVLTITREQEDTSARTIVVGDQVAQTLTAGEMNRLESEIAGKADASHTHATSEIDGLDAALADKADSSHSHSNATTSAAGFMSSTDKTKLDGVASGATAYSNSSVLAYLLSLVSDGQFFKRSGSNIVGDTPTVGGGDVAGDTHAAASKTTPADDDEIPGVDSAASWGLKKFTWANIKAALKTYFDGIYSTFNGAYSSLSGIPTSFTPSAHTHPTSEVTGLDTALAGKAASSHTHAQSEVTGLVTALAGKEPTLADASETVKGKVELATTAEALTGTDTARAVTPAGVKAAVDQYAPVAYAPGTMTVDFGTLVAGVVGNLAATGGTDVDIQEASGGANALQVQFDWTGVARLQDLTFFGYYQGGAGHTVVAEAWNWGGSAWEALGTISTASAKQWYSFACFNAVAYINSGAVRMRLRHSGNGIASHHLYLDKLEVNYGGSSGATSVGASSVAFVPAGNIAATNVQAAISELDTEKAAASHTHATSEITGLDTALAGKAAASHTHAQSEITNLVTDLGNKQAASTALSTAQAQGTASIREIGTATPQALGTAAPGSSLKPAADDHVHPNPKLDDLSATDDNTDLDASTAKHGLLPKLGGGTTNFLRADGTWAAPPGGSGGERWDASFDGQGNVIAAGVVCSKHVHATSTITQASIAGYAAEVPTSGSITIDVYKRTPSAGTLGSRASLGSIALSSAQHNRSTGLSWAVTAGDVIEFVPSGTIATVTRVFVGLGT
jgi:hypothetical protein